MSIGDFFSRHKIKLISGIFALLFFFAFFLESIFVYIYPGQSGVLFRSLSEEPIEESIYSEGLYVIAPWNKMYVYDIRKQRIVLDVGALTSNGLSVNLRITAIFHPTKNELIELLTHVGDNYDEKIVGPTIFSSVREVIGNYLPEDLYTTAMHIIQQQILTEAQRELAALPFIVENVVVESIILPGSINEAIEFKLRHQQEALAYEYILKREADEAKRRGIEADSIRAYNEEIESSLNDDVLQWLKIKALSDLSQSDNSKVVVLEADSRVAPIVIDTDKP